MLATDHFQVGQASHKMHPLQVKAIKDSETYYAPRVDRLKGLEVLTASAKRSEVGTLKLAYSIYRLASLTGLYAGDTTCTEKKLPTYEHLFHVEQPPNRA